MSGARAEEYRAAIEAVVMCAHLLRQHEIPQFIRDIDRADAFGPILDPTLWRDKHGAMSEDCEMLEAAMPLWRLAEKLRAMRTTAGEEDGDAQ